MSNYKGIFRALCFLLFFLSLGPIVNAQDLPGQVKYPAAQDSAASLVEVRDGASTLLKITLSSVATTATVSDTSKFPASGYLVLDGREIILYTGKTATTFTGLVRGSQGTPALTHAAGIRVEQRIISLPHNTLSVAIRALEAKVGEGAYSRGGDSYFRTDAAGKSYWASLAELSAALNFREVDGTPTLTAVPTAEFDQADGFVLSQQAGNVARIDLAAVPNSVLANSQVTINGTANRITGGGAVALGGNITLNLDPTLFPQPGAGDVGKFYKVTGADAGLFALLADADIPDTISLTNLTQIGTRNYSDLQNIPTSFAPSAHATSHQNGGGDEIATATPGANLIPKAGAGGKLDDGWLSANVSLLGPSIDLGGAEATGTLAAARFPALTGHITTPGGSLATSLQPTAITDQTEETTIANDDQILISDTSAGGALRRMSRLNFVAGLGGGASCPTCSTNAVIKWDSTAFVDSLLIEDAANALAQRNSTNPQTFRVYNTFTDVSNYERLRLAFSSNTAFLSTERAGTGSARSLAIGSESTGSLFFRSSGINHWQLDGATAGTLRPVLDDVVALGSASARIQSAHISNSLQLYQGYIQFNERASAPGATADAVKFYAKDVAGKSTPFFQQDDGTEVQLGAAGAASSVQLWLPSAGCNASTASTLWDLPTANAPTPACATGTNTQKGIFEFPDSDGDFSAQITHRLPAAFTGTLNAVVWWFSSSVTTGDVVWQLQTSCVADGEPDDPAWNTASTVTDTAQGTVDLMNQANISGVNVTGCAAGEILHLRLLRNRTHASDSITGVVKLVGVDLTIQ